MMRESYTTTRKCNEHTISRITSPAVKDSPSFFFHSAIPPSVMVGLIAGMVNLDKACLRADAWNSEGVIQELASNLRQYEILTPGQDTTGDEGGHEER